MTTTHRHGIAVRLAAVAALAAGLLCAGAIRRAQACEPIPVADTLTQWKVVIDPVGIATAPSADTFFTPASGQSFTYLVKNTKLYAIVNETSPTVTNLCGTFPAVTAGAFKWSGLAGGFRDLGSPVMNFASPVPLSIPAPVPGCHEAIFVTTDAGMLFKVNAADGSLEAPFAGHDLRRTLCPADKVIASPAVQLYAYSNSTFKDAANSAGHVNDDLVFVITRYSTSTNPSNACYGGDSRNRIYALWASDLSAKWIFNANGEHSVGFGSEGCSINYENNTLYCGTNMPGGVAGTDSLWALDTLTGRLIWSANAGPLVARPMVAKDASGSTKVFTASNASTSSMRKYHPDGDGFGGPILDWQISLAGTVQRNVWPEPRGSSHSIFVVDTLGNLYRFTDQTSTVAAVPGWPIHDAGFQGMPVFAPNLNKLFIGRSDGTLQQIDAATATKEGAVTVGSIGTSAIVGDAVLDVQGTDIDRVLAISAEGYVIRKEIGTFGSADNSPCVGSGFACTGPEGTTQGCTGYQARNPEYDPCSGTSICDINQQKCVMVTCQSNIDCAAPATCHCPGGGAPPCAGGFTGNCVVPDGTPCDDNRACSFAFQCTDNVDCPAQGDGSFTTCQCTDGTAPPCAGNSGYCRAASCAGGPYGVGNNCNNVCQAGRCSSTFFEACPCVNAGDAACGAGQACCGSTSTTTACTTDSQCGPGVCPSGNGSCQWVTAVNGFRCRCGICADLNTDATRCGNCATNCNPVSDPNNPSVCQASQCDASACDTPTTPQILLATATAGNNIDPDAVTYDRNAGICSAYVSGYTPKVIRRVASGGAFLDAISSDAAFLSGVAVPRSGAEVFGCFINDAVGFQTPGLAQGVIGSPLTKPAIGFPSIGAGPFIGPASTKLNHGPVGPAFNYSNYSASNKQLYFGNWSANGDLIRASFNGTAWAVTNVAAYSGTGRITALHFERRPKVIGQAAHSTLYVGHGTILSLVDIDTSPVAQIDIDLASMNVYAPGLSGYGDGVVTGIRSIAVHPKFGDIYVEVNDASNNSWIMNLDEPAHAGRHQLDVQKELNPCMRGTDRPPSCSGTPSGKLPGLFVGDEGRLVMTPSYDLLRIGRNKLTGAVTYTEYRATSCTGPECNN